MLFWLATLVEMVPGNCVALKRIPAPAIVRPFSVKQFWVTVLFCAPRAGSVVLPKLVSDSPSRPLLSKVFLVIDEFLGPPCKPSKTLLLNVLPLIGPSPHALLPRFTPVP